MVHLDLPEVRLSLSGELGAPEQVSYAIGVAQPLSVHVDTYGTGSKPDKEILAAVLKAFDFRPGLEPSVCDQCVSDVVAAE